MNVYHAKNISRNIAACLLVLLCCSGFTVTLIEKAGSKELVQALQSRDKQDYATAATLLQQALGKARDQETKSRVLAELGKLSIRSRLPDMPPAEGLQLLHQAEELGNITVLMPLGNAYHYGLGVAVDVTKAAQYYKKASSTNSRAFYEMALIQKGTAPAEGNFKHYITLLEAQEVVARGDALSVARQFAQGGIVMANAAKAEYWYRKAMQAGSLSATNELAALWEKQAHQPSSDIIVLWKQLAEKGRADVMLKLAMAYESGVLTAKDTVQADKFFQEAAKVDPKLAYRIARFYEVRALNAVDTSAAATKAVQWMQKAVAQGDSDAMLRMAGYYRKGVLVKQDMALSRQFYQQSAQAGNVKAAAMLTKIDEQEKAKLLRAAAHQKRLVEARQKKAAQAQAKKDDRKGKPAGVAMLGFAEAQAGARQGNPVAMRDLARAYMQGKGAGRDTAKGLEWLNKAAEAGNSNAMVDLATAYATGNGVEYNLTEAYAWYAKAAQAGNVEAQYQLGLGYARGIGVKKNKEKAKHWLELAKDNGYSAASSIIDTIEKQ